MAIFSNAQAISGLWATATPVGPNVSGNQQVGIGPSVLSLTDADTAYSFRVLASTTAQISINFLAGTVSLSSGAATILGGNGKDCEGVTIVTMGGVYALQWKRATSGNPANLVNIQDSGANELAIAFGETYQLAATTFCALNYVQDDPVLSISHSAGTETIDFVVIGK